MIVADALARAQKFWWPKLNMYARSHPIRVLDHCDRHPRNSSFELRNT